MLIYKKIGNQKIAYLSSHISSTKSIDTNTRLDSELQGIIDRAYELKKDFRKELDYCIENMYVTERAKNLYPEVLIKLRSALDIIMARVWKEHIFPDWKKKKERKEPNIYFPICKNKTNFEKKMRDMGMQKLQTLNEDVYNLILNAQPFKTGRNDLLDLRDMTNLSKHTRLVLQKLDYQQAIKITSSKGIVIHSKGGVKFPDSGIFGATVDPKTQRIMPTPDVKDEEVIWVWCSDERRHNPLIFCETLCQGTAIFLSNILSSGSCLRGTKNSANREFEKRGRGVKFPRGAKTENVIRAVNEQAGKFSISEIERLCPAVSKAMIQTVFRKLQKQKKIICLGRGRSAKWKQIG